MLETSRSEADGRYAIIDRIHGLDDGSWEVGDTLRIHEPESFDFDGGLFFVHDHGAPFDFIPIRSGEVICSTLSDVSVDLAAAIEIALSNDCMAAAEEALGPIPACNDTFATTSCSTGAGAAELMAIFFGGALLISVRHRRARSGG